MDNLQRDIYRTLVYFSYFGYPLTVFELWKYLYRPSQAWTYSQVATAVGTLPATSVESHHGFYGLPDEKHGDVEAQVNERHDRYLDAVRKYRRLKWVLRYLRCLPFIRGVAVCNTLAFHHTRPESDIDLFVITAPGRVWTTRFLVVAPLRLLRLRPREAKRDPIDISFLVSEVALNFDALRLQPNDPYFTYWLATLRPVIDRGGIFDRLVAENQTSLSSLPNTQTSDFTGPIPACALSELRTGRLGSAPTLERSRIFLSEKWFEKLQRDNFPQDIRDLQNHDSRVVVSSDVLKFHKNDRRLEISDYLEAKMKLCETL